MPNSTISVKLQLLKVCFLEKMHLPVLDAVLGVDFFEGFRFFATATVLPFEGCPLAAEVTIRLGPFAAAPFWV